MIVAIPGAPTHPGQSPHGSGALKSTQQLIKVFRKLLSLRESADPPFICPGTPNSEFGLEVDSGVWNSEKTNFDVSELRSSAFGVLTRFVREHW